VIHASEFVGLFKELAGWIRREPDILSAADVAMATLHLKQFVKKLAA
jgi:hypothetical protein